MADLKMGDMWKLQLGFDKVFRTRETENIIVENFDYREVADDEGITFSGSDF